MTELQTNYNNNNNFINFQCFFDKKKMLKEVQLLKNGGYGSRYSSSSLRIALQSFFENSNPHGGVAV